MNKGPDTPKGFRDVEPKLAQKRRMTINQIAEVLEGFGFLPLETPTIEFADVLLGKYGEEEKLIYQFKDRGDRDLALRYDLTVPLARYIANNLGLLNPTFSRYQVGQVFRGEKPQAGRFREFTQFDFDTVGLTSEKDSTFLEDAKVIAAALKSARKVGLEKAKMAINDRRNFSNIPPEVVRAFDKIYKIGEEGVKKEVISKSYSEDDFKNFKTMFTLGKKATVEPLFRILKSKYKLIEGSDFFFDPTLARGLDYYTGAIFELKPTGKPEEQSIGGGGRYDKLIGMIAGRDIPATGFSFGLDRLIELI